MLNAQGLATEAVEQERSLWHLRPKLHQMEHLQLANIPVCLKKNFRVYDFCPKYGNCKYFANYANEDLIGRVKCLGNGYKYIYMYILGRSKEAPATFSPKDTVSKSH